MSGLTYSVKSCSSNNRRRLWWSTSSSQCNHPLHWTRFQSRGSLHMRGRLLLSLRIVVEEMHGRRNVWRAITAVQKSVKTVC